MLTTDARRYIVEFTTSVIDAIKELHATVSLAHLDIRLDNICFKNDCAVLIDFDRSCALHESARYLVSKWGESAMYMPPSQDWTVERVDWRQLGIMVLALLNDTSEKSYHSEPTNSQHPFFHKLVKEG